MEKHLAEVTAENVTDVMEELNAAFYDIPFENSDYQNRAFVMASQITPARAYRAVGLRMFSKIQAVKASVLQRKRRAIDIAEKEHQLEHAELSTWDRQRLELDLFELHDAGSYEDKLLNDALRELNVMYAEFKKLPRYNRDQFEAEEIEHFTTRLERAMQGVQGARESLVNMQQDLPRWDENVSRALSRPEMQALKNMG